MREPQRFIDRPLHQAPEDTRLLALSTEFREKHLLVEGLWDNLRRCSLAFHGVNRTDFSAIRSSGKLHTSNTAFIAAGENPAYDTYRLYSAAALTLDFAKLDGGILVLRGNPNTPNLPPSLDHRRSCLDSLLSESTDTADEIAAWAYAAMKRNLPIRVSTAAFNQGDPPVVNGVLIHVEHCLVRFPITHEDLESTDRLTMIQRLRAQAIVQRALMLISDPEKQVPLKSE